MQKKRAKKARPTHVMLNRLIYVRLLSFGVWLNKRAEAPSTFMGYSEEPGASPLNLPCDRLQLGNLSF